MLDGKMHETDVNITDAVDAGLTSACGGDGGGGIPPTTTIPVVWVCPLGSTRAGDIIPANVPGNPTFDRTSANDRDDYCREVCPVGSARAGREIPHAEWLNDRGASWCNDRCTATPSVSDLRGQRTGDWWRLTWTGATSCYDYEASTEQMPMPFKGDEDWWFDTSNFRTPSRISVDTWNFKWLSVSADHFDWPDAQRCLQSFLGWLGWIASGCGSIDLPEPPGGAMHGYHRYSATPRVHRIDVTVRGQQLITTAQQRCVRREGGSCVERAPVIQTNRSTPAAWTSPWMCPKHTNPGYGNPHVAASHSLRNIPANVTSEHDRLAAINTAGWTHVSTTAHRVNQLAEQRTVYRYCYGFTPTVTLNVPDGYRDAQPNQATVEVTFTKQHPQPAGHADCDTKTEPTVTRTYLPNATDGEQATPVVLSGGRVLRDADGNPVDEHGNPVAPPSLDAACTYTVDYPATAAGGNLRLDPNAAGHDVEVSADDPQTQATYEEAFFAPQVTINIPDGHVGGRSSGKALFSNMTFEPVHGSHADCVQERAPLFYAHDVGDRTRPGGALPKLDRRCTYDVKYPATNNVYGDEATLTLVTPVDDLDTAAREDQVSDDDRGTTATYARVCAKPELFWSGVGVSLSFGDEEPSWWRRMTHHPWSPVNWSDDATRSPAFGRQPVSVSVSWTAVDANPNFDWNSDASDCERAVKHELVVVELPPDNQRRAVAGAALIDEDDRYLPVDYLGRSATLPPAAADVTNEGALVSLRLSLAACVSPRTATRTARATGGRAARRRRVGRRSCAPLVANAPPAPCKAATWTIVCRAYG